MENCRKALAVSLPNLKTTGVEIIQNFYLLSEGLWELIPQITSVGWVCTMLGQVDISVRRQARKLWQDEDKETGRRNYLRSMLFNGRAKHSYTDYFTAFKFNKAGRDDKKLGRILMCRIRLTLPFVSPTSFLSFSEVLIYPGSALQVL